MPKLERTTPEQEETAVASEASSSSSTAPPQLLLTCETVLSLPVVVVSQSTAMGQHRDNNSNTNGTRIAYVNPQPAWHCCFSRDGTYLAVCYGAPDPCIRVYHKEPPPLARHNHDNNGQGGGKRAAKEATKVKPTVAGGVWKLHATLSGIQTRTIRWVSFAPIHFPLTLAAASFDGTVAIWEQQQQPQQQQTTTSECLWECTAQLEGHDNEVKCVEWNATGTLLATCGRDKTVWIWECYLPGTVGGSAVTNYSDNIDNGADFECIAVLNGHEADVKCVKFAASHGQWGDGDEIALSGSYDDTVRIWAEDAGDWYCAAVLSHVHASTIWTLAVAPSGTRFVTGSADHSLAIYKCYSAQELKAQQQLASSSSDNAVANEGRASATKAAWKCVGKLPDAHTATIYSVDYAPARASHGRIVSGGADNRIQIYREVVSSSSSSDKPLFVLDAATTVPGGDINCVCWHPYDGSVLASAGDDGNVRIWNYKV